jgi:hypothetical protein
MGLLARRRQLSNIFFGPCDFTALMTVAWDARTLVKCSEHTPTSISPFACYIMRPKTWTGLAALKYSIIKISESQDDDAFLEELRNHIGPCVTSGITGLIPTILLLSRLEIRGI